MSKLPYNEAYAVVRHYVGSLAELTWNMSEREYHVAVTDMAARLSWYVGASVKETFVRDLLDAFEELHTLDNGTHEDIRVNATHSIDNRDQLRERIMQRIHEETEGILLYASLYPELERAA